RSCKVIVVELDDEGQYAAVNRANTGRPTGGEGYAHRCGADITIAVARIHLSARVTIQKALDAFQAPDQPLPRLSRSWRLVRTRDQLVKYPTGQAQHVQAEEDHQNAAKRGDEFLQVVSACIEEGNSRVGQKSERDKDECDPRHEEQRVNQHN